MLHLELVSTSETKYTGHWWVLPSLVFSWTMAALTALGEAAMYSSRGSSGSGLVNVARSENIASETRRRQLVLAPSEVFGTA